MGLFYGFGGSHHRQMDNIALVQHGLIKVIDVRCGDKSLTTAFHSGHQRIASSAVQLAHHIVKKEHRLLLDDLLDDGLQPVYTRVQWSAAVPDFRRLKRFPHRE